MHINLGININCLVAPQIKTGILLTEAKFVIHRKDPHVQFHLY